jgi:iron complex transport system substrate-binding protein
VSSRRFLIAILPILAAAVLAALPVRAQTSYPLTVVDDAGNTLLLPGPPRRIVSLTLATDEILLTLLAKSRLIAVTTFAADRAVSNVADLSADIPHKLAMNVEAIVSLQADLVLVAPWSDPGPVQQLRNAGVPVFMMASGLTVRSIEEKIEKLSRMSGEPERGRAMVAGMDARLAAVFERISRLPREKRARVLDYGIAGSAQGRGSSWDEIVRLAGLVDAVADIAPDRWGQVPLSREKILQIDPDILILPGWVYGDPRGAAAFSARITGDPAFRTLAAVRAKRVYMMPENLKGTTSQYIVSAVEWLARTAYPALFD